MDYLNHHFGWRGKLYRDIYSARSINDFLDERKDLKLNHWIKIFSPAVMSDDWCDYRLPLIVIRNVDVRFLKSKEKEKRNAIYVYGHYYQLNDLSGKIDVFTDSVYFVPAGVYDDTDFGITDGKYSSAFILYDPRNDNSKLYLLSKGLRKEQKKKSLLDLISDSLEELNTLIQIPEPAR